MTARTPPAEPPLHSLEAVAEVVRCHADLNAQQRNEYLEAIDAICRALKMVPAEAMADPVALRARLEFLSQADAAMPPARWQHLLERFSAALKLAGVRRHAGRVGAGAFEEVDDRSVGAAGELTHMHREADRSRFHA